MRKCDIEKADLTRDKDAIQEFCPPASTILIPIALTGCISTIPVVGQIPLWLAFLIYEK